MIFAKLSVNMKKRISEVNFAENSLRKCAEIKKIAWRDALPKARHGTVAKL